MSTTKLVVVSHESLTRLACGHFRDYLKDKGVDIELEFVDVGTPEDLPRVAEESGATALRIDAELASEWLLTNPVQPLAVSRARAADLYTKKMGLWEPDLILESALHDVIVRQGRTLELNDWAYVIGEGAELRVVAGVCLSLGFRKIKLVSDRDDDLAAQKEALGRMYVGCDIVPLPAHSLTLQTVEASLLVNASDLTQKTEIANDLAYFNFMREGGLIIDLKSIQRKNAVLEEAMRAGLRVLPPHEVTGVREVWMAKRLGFDEVFSPSAYLDSWLECLQRHQAENRPSV